MVPHDAPFQNFTNGSLKWSARALDEKSLFEPLSKSFFVRETNLTNVPVLFVEFSLDSGNTDRYYNKDGFVHYMLKGSQVDFTWVSENWIYHI